MEAQIEKILEILEPCLKKDKDGYYLTTYGKKTLQGLREIIKSTLNNE